MIDKDQYAFPDLGTVETNSWLGLLPELKVKLKLFIYLYDYAYWQFEDVDQSSWFQLAVMSMLDMKSLLMLARTCHEMLDLCQEPTLWRRLYLTDFGSK